MAQVTNVKCLPGENNFAVEFSGFAPNNEFMQILVWLEKGSTTGLADFMYVPAPAVDRSDPFKLLHVFMLEDPDVDVGRSDMLDDDVNYPGLKDRVRNFITSARKMAAADGSSGGEEIQDTETFPREFRERCIHLMERFPVNEEPMDNVYSHITGSDDPNENYMEVDGAFGGPVATPSSASYTDWTTS